MDDPVFESLSRGGPPSPTHKGEPSPPPRSPISSIAGNAAPRISVSSVTGIGDSTQAHLLLAFSIVPDDDGNDTQENGDGSSDNGNTSLPSGIAVTKSGDYVIVDNTNKQGKVFTRTGDYMKFAFGVGLLNDPWDVFMSETGKIVVSDSSGGLKVFSSKGKFLQASEFGCHLMDPKGVAYHRTTKELFIADPPSSCVYVHDPEGIVTNILTEAGQDIFMGTKYIHTDISGNIYISDTAGNKIYAFDAEKDYKWTFGETKLNPNDDPNAVLNPGALCTDRHGNLLVADTGKGRVLAISASTGVSRGDVLTWEDGLADPMGIVVDDNTGNLVVTEATTGLVKVFSYDHLPCCTKHNGEEKQSDIWNTLTDEKM